MKAVSSINAVCAMALCLCAQQAFSQGSLSPPGPPAPMMRTLEQVEPRIPITSLPWTITAPGSYYLTTNLVGAAGTNGITVLADHVTIDLRGFALLGGTAAGCGIIVSNQHVDLRVCNGTIANWPAQGVQAQNASNSQFDQLRVSQNGSTGLQAGRGSTIAACVAEGNQGGEGISVLERCLIKDSISCSNAIGFKLQGAGGRITDCVAAGNTNSGIVVQGVICSVNNCTATANGQDGINVADGCRVDLCTVIINGRHGIMAGNSCTVKNSTSNGNTGMTSDGVQVGTNCWVNGNTANGNGSAGIRAAGNSRIDDNIVCNNNVGIICTMGGNNFVARNTAHGNVVADYSIAAGNKSAQVIVLAPGPGFINTDPTANFSY